MHAIKLEMHSEFTYDTFNLTCVYQHAFTKKTTCNHNPLHSNTNCTYTVV